MISPRPTKACIECRERRVKCDRTRPTCSECAQRGNTCQYVSSDSRRFRFANPTTALREQANGNNVPSRDPQSSIVRDSVNKSAATDDPSDPDWISGILRMIDGGDDNSQADIRRILRPQAPRFGTTIPISSLGRQDIDLIAECLPSRDQYQRHLECFLRHVHPLLPVCHGPTLEKDSWAFWESYPNAPVDMLALVLSIVYSTSICTVGLDTSRSHLQIFTLYQRLLQVMDFPNGIICSSVRLLQAYLIVNTCTANQIEPLSSYGFLPSAVRVAQSMGLHMRNDTKDLIEREVRYRIWWHLIYLDMEASIATGLPAIIRQGSLFPPMPSYVHDNAITEDRILSNDCCNRSPMMVAMHGRWEWALRMQTWLTTSPHHAEITEFRSEMAKLKQSIPRGIDHQWAQTYIDLRTDQAISILAPSFFRGKESEAPSFEGELLRSCYSVLQCYNRLSSLSETGDFRWFVPGHLHPVLAATLLLVHIRDSTAAKSNEKRDLMALLDRTFDLIGHQLLPNPLTTHMKIPILSYPENSKVVCDNMISFKERIFSGTKWLPLTRGMASASTSKLQLKMNSSRQQPLSSAFQEYSRHDPMDLFEWDKLDTTNGHHDINAVEGLDVSITLL